MRKQGFVGIEVKTLKISRGSKQQFSTSQFKVKIKIILTLEKNEVKNILKDSLED